MFHVNLPGSSFVCGWMFFFWVRVSAVGCFFVFFLGGVFQARWQESVGRFGDRTFTIFERRRLSFQVGFVVVVEKPCSKSFLLYTLED